jgi:hypothetical protein
MKIYTISLFALGGIKNDAIIHTVNNMSCMFANNKQERKKAFELTRKNIKRISDSAKRSGRKLNQMLYFINIASYDTETKVIKTNHINTKGSNFRKLKKSQS